MNYLEELQKINDDYKKCKNVILSCVWDTQLETAGNFCNKFVNFHVGRLGFFKRYKHSAFYTVKDWFNKEYRKRKNILDYIDLCVGELKELIENQKEEVYMFSDGNQIGYGDHNSQVIHRIKKEIKNWEEKKEKDDLYEDRKTPCEKLPLD